MNVADFLRAKNEIIHNHIKLILVPEDQIKDIPYRGSLSWKNDNSCCPYCLFFDPWNECKGCPMAEAGNRCSKDGSTYSIITNRFFAITDPEAPWSEELRALVFRWNLSQEIMILAED